MSAAKYLSDDERIFCELFVNGSAPYAGNAAKCYKDVFLSNDDKTNNHKASLLLNKKEVADYISELEELNVEDAKNIKRYLTANLKHIVDETSRDVYQDRRGKLLSPAALRSVAVSASKALMEMYPVRESAVNKLEIGSSNEGGITFNLVVPSSNANNDDMLNETE